MSEDTIAAIATPLGEGGLAVIRLSGPSAVAVADACFRGSGRSPAPLATAPTHTVHHGWILRGGDRVDEVLVTLMRAPRTYTREDVVEISCHGGLLPARFVLETVLAGGARLAHPGEFTQRAFLNGRLDLAQAEAVADLIHSRTELALRAAHEQLAGKLSQRINHLREDLLLALAHVEAHLDFPEEDIAPDTRQQLLARLERGGEFMDGLLRTAQEGRILRRGVRAVITGPPNAGKSSLLNQLLGHDRAIVTPLPGTTRDTIEETANIRGLPVVLVDTAGLRAAGDEIEAEGIRRSRESIERADLVLQVWDQSQTLPPDAADAFRVLAGRKHLVVLNKCDLPARIGPESLAALRPPESAAPLAVLAVSCQTGEGIEGLKDAIKAAVWAGEIRAEMLEVMLNARHHQAVQRAHDATERALALLRQDGGLELVATELHLAVDAVGEVTGKTTTEDLLDAIFSQFCLGK